jgi:hypothetical protein
MAESLENTFDVEESLLEKQLEGCSAYRKRDEIRRRIMILMEL